MEAVEEGRPLPAGQLLLLRPAQPHLLQARGRPTGLLPALCSGPAFTALHAMALGSWRVWACLWAGTETEHRAEARGKPWPLPRNLLQPLREKEWGIGREPLTSMCSTRDMSLARRSNGPCSRGSRATTSAWNLALGYLSGMSTACWLEGAPLACLQPAGPQAYAT